MRHAKWDSAADVYIILGIAILIIVGIGYAMCRMMGWEQKAFWNYVGTILAIGAAFLLAAQILSGFF